MSFTPDEQIFDLKVEMNSIDIEKVILNPDELEGCKICYSKIYARGIKTYFCEANGHEFCESCYLKNPNRLTCAICREYGMINLPKRQFKEIMELYQSKTHVCCPLNEKSILDEEERLTVSFLYQGEITSVPIQVLETDKHCSWEGSLQELEEHLESCTSLPVPCPYCYKEKLSSPIGEEHEIFHRREVLYDHLKKCEFRPVTCSLCSEDVPFSKLDCHTTKCPMRIIACIFECGAKFPLSGYDHHVLNECPNYSVACPWREKLGCSFFGKRRDMEKHLRDTELHLSLPVLTSCLECDQTFSLDDLQDHVKYCGLKKCSNHANGCCFKDFFDLKIRRHEQRNCVFQRVMCKNEGCNRSIMKKDMIYHHETCQNDVKRASILLKRYREENEVLKSKATKYKRILDEYRTHYDEGEEYEDEEEDTSETLGSDTETVSVVSITTHLSV